MFTLLFLFIPLFSLALVPSQILAPSSSSIIGGTSTSGTFSWMVFLQITKSTSIFDCAGTLITPNFILTAAHCAYNSTLIRASSSRYDLTKTTAQELGVDYDVLATFIHADYDPLNSSLNDIALLAVRIRQNYGKTAPTPALISLKTDASITSYTAYGWGDTSTTSTLTSPTLNQIQLTLIPTAQCQLSYSTAIAASQMCAGFQGQTTCKGDSGGPLVSISPDGQAIVQGITSWGTELCGQSPSGFTRVSYFSEWIQSTLQNAQSLNFQSGGERHAAVMGIVVFTFLRFYV